jgi:hypothetical protein
MEVNKMAKREPKETKKVKGIVESVNDKGIKIDGEWYNFSKFNRVEIPSEGDAVEIEVKGEWIKSLRNLTSAGQQREGKNQSIDQGYPYNPPCPSQYCNFNPFNLRKASRG